MTTTSHRIFNLSAAAASSLGDVHAAGGAAADSVNEQHQLVAVLRASLNQKQKQLFTRPYILK